MFQNFWRLSEVRQGKAPESNMLMLETVYVLRCLPTIHTIQVLLCDKQWQGRQGGMKIELRKNLLQVRMQEGLKLLNRADRQGLEASYSMLAWALPPTRQLFMARATICRYVISSDIRFICLILDIEHCK